MTERPILATAFRHLHKPGAGFLMPNAWDPGTAILLADAGFEAIGTTSAGIAFSLGRPDYAIPQGATTVSREEMFERMRQIADAVDIPVNGDIEDGYGDTPEAVAETVRFAIDAGLAGANIEDYLDGALYDEALAIERIVAARETIDAANSDFVLTARSDGQLIPHKTSLADSVSRSNRYREAGADCLYVPGVNDLEQNMVLAQEIDGPINVVIGLGSTTLTVASLRRVGVTRISLGGTIARAAFGLVRNAARELLETGTLDFARDQMLPNELNDLFAKHEQSRTDRT